MFLDIRMYQLIVSVLIIKFKISFWALNSLKYLSVYYYVYDYVAAYIIMGTVGHTKVKYNLI